VYFVSEVVFDVPVRVSFETMRSRYYGRMVLPRQAALRSLRYDSAGRSVRRLRGRVLRGGQDGRC